MAKQRNKSRKRNNERAARLGPCRANRSADGLYRAHDMFPTLMAMADLKMPETRGIADDGSTTPVWSSDKDTQVGAFTANEFLQDLKVRPVAVSEVGK